MTKITTDFVGGETTAEDKARITAIAEWWLGSGALAAAATRGDVRTLLNTVCIPPITSGELCGSFYPKLNALNDPDTYIVNKLFGASEAGFLLNFDDLASLYQDALAATPLTLPDQSVGMALDVSRGMALGPELVTNGGFDTDTAWTKGAGWTIGGGFANASSASGILVQAVPVVSGKFYLVGWSATFSAGQFQLRVGGLDGGYYSTSGVKSAIVQAGAAGILEFVATVMSGSVDNVSIREIQSLPARQASLGLRPKWGRMPKGGRRNLLTYTEDLSNAVWVKESATVSDQGGGVWKVIERVGLPANGLYGHDVFYSGYGIPASSPRVLVIEAKAAERSRISIHGRSATTWGWATVDLITGATVAGGSGGNLSVTINSAVPLSDGWWRITATVAMIWAYAGTFTVSPNVAGEANSGINYSGDGASGVLVRYPMLDTAATAYQKVTNAFDATEAGLPSYGYIRPDLMDDYLTVTTPAAQTGDVMVFGRKGTWLETGVAYGSGAAVAIGPTTMTGLPAGLLQAVQGPVSDNSGGLVGVLAIGRSLTEAERTAALNYYKARGAAGLLVAGAELVTNGTFDTGISPWFDLDGATGRVAWDASGKLAVSDLAGSDGRATYNLGTSLENQFVLVTLTISGASGYVTFGGVNPANYSQFSASVLGVGTHRIIVKLGALALVGSFGITLACINTNSTAFFDNVSVKPLTVTP